MEALAAAEAVRNALLEKLFVDDPSVDIEAIGVPLAVSKLDKLLSRMHEMREELHQRGRSEFTGTVGGEWVGQEVEGHRREVDTLNQWLKKAREEKKELLGEGEGEGRGGEEGGIQCRRGREREEEGRREGYSAGVISLSPLLSCWPCRGGEAARC